MYHIHHEKHSKGINKKKYNPLRKKKLWRHSTSVRADEELEAVPCSDDSDVQDSGKESGDGSVHENCVASVSSFFFLVHKKGKKSPFHLLHQFKTPQVKETIERWTIKEASTQLSQNQIKEVKRVIIKKLLILYRKLLNRLWTVQYLVIILCVFS